MMSSAFFIQYQDLSRPIHLLINTANVCRFNFFSSLSLFNFSLSDLPDLYFNYRLLISNHRGTGKRRPFNFSPYTMLNGSLQLEGGAKIYTKNKPSQIIHFILLGNIDFNSPILPCLALI